MTGQVALEKLIQGNGRFVAGNGAGAEGVDLAGSAEGAIGKLIEEIAPAVRPVLEQSEKVDDVELEAIKANIWHTMGKLVQRSPIISEAVRSGDVELAGAVYSLETGSVTILTEDGY
jgi:carbonic anhydrase